MKTPEEFIEFFEAIPDEDWICGSIYGPKCCALGHLGVKSYFSFENEPHVIENVLCLGTILDPYNQVNCSDTGFFPSAANIIWRTNDNDSGNYKGKPPKERIINTLKDKINK